LLKGENVWTHDELTRGKYAIKGFAEFFRKRVVLGVYVEEWDGHGKIKAEMLRG
jgi:hypothetical protein